MPSYHPDAEIEFEAIYVLAARGVKMCLGMMIQRGHRIDTGKEPLSTAEHIGAGSGVSELYKVEFTHSLFSSVVVVYQEVGQDVTVLALDATQGLVRLAQPPGAPDAQARAWKRSS
jgi:hypothetical protein